MVRCLKALVSFMWQMGGAYDSIFMPLRGLAVPFSTEVDSQIAHKRPDFGQPLSTAIRMLYYKERYALLMK